MVPHLCLSLSSHNMRISFSLNNPLRPCTFSPPSDQMVKHCGFEAMLHHRFNTMHCTPSHFLRLTSRSETKVARKWTEYQGLHNWDGLLDPLDDDLRNEILRYGHFVEAAYDSFQFDVMSPFYGMCRHLKTSLFSQTRLTDTGYRLTKYLRATSSIKMPQWVEKASNATATRSSWIGYVAVCDDKREIARLGRRDIVIAYRGTATCLEWLENLRVTLSHLPENGSVSDSIGPVPMVESGFLSLYSSGTATSPSLKQIIREEVSRLLQTYAGEPLSLTITGHSLGAALATLTAYDIKVTFEQAPLVTVVSFGGPRVGNHGFRRCLDKQGTKVLRIVNSDDVVTKVPGFVLDDRAHRSNNSDGGVKLLPWWVQQYVEKTQSQWLYSEVGKELKLNSKRSPHLTGTGINIAMHHDLKTYLHLIEGFASSKSPFDISAKGGNDCKEHLSAV